MKSFYDFNTSSPQERQERNKLYPELAKFHIALREELSEEEYNEFYNSEKEAIKPHMLNNTTTTRQWIQI
ncbi:hypothetical protein [Pontibacter ruber]|uniref:Uncharacterized protein n=1 Tax=Pontibacter ruber TaxID=1343895 RepID=A0ABW5CVK0_9BACT|nr:hypothetical protein [Pontibacter ruber]